MRDNCSYNLLKSNNGIYQINVFTIQIKKTTFPGENRRFF